MCKQKHELVIRRKICVSHLLTYGLRSAYAWFAFLLTYLLTLPRQEGRRDVWYARCDLSIPYSRFADFCCFRLR